jgi:hypothetical protein
MNINKAVDKDYESKSLKEIAAAPIDALEGVSAAGRRTPGQGFQRQVGS